MVSELDLRDGLHLGTTAFFPRAAEPLVGAHHSTALFDHRRRDGLHPPKRTPWAGYGCADPVHPWFAVPYVGLPCRRSNVSRFSDRRGARPSDREREARSVRSSVPADFPGGRLYPERPAARA